MAAGLVVGLLRTVFSATVGASAAWVAAFLLDSGLLLAARRPTPRHHQWSALEWLGFACPEQDCGESHRIGDCESAIMKVMVGNEQINPSATAARLMRAARGKRGMSQRDLAVEAGVPQSTVAMVESGRRQPSVVMLERLLEAAGFRLETSLVNAIRPSELLRKHRREVAEVIARYPVARVWVFGSVARGDDRPQSDLDLLVELTSGASFADYVGLEDDLAAVLGCPVDVVTTRELESNDLFRRRVHRHLRPLEGAA